MSIRKLQRCNTGTLQQWPLRLIAVEAGDLRVLAEAAARLGHALAGDPAGEVAEAMAAGAEAAAPTFGPAPEPAQLVESLARACGLLDLAVTADTVLLAELLAGAGEDDIVLDPVAEVAYQRTVHRFNVMWAGGSAVDLFLY